MPVYDLCKRAVSLGFEWWQIEIEEYPVGTGLKKPIGERSEARTVPGPRASGRDRLIVNTNHDHLAAHRLGADLVA